MDTAHQTLHTLTFAMKPSEEQPTGQPLRFEGVAYSGGVVPSYGWAGNVAIDLSGLQNPDGDELPLLVDHDARLHSIAGKGRIHRVTSPEGVQQLHITGELTEATEAGKQAAALMREGCSPPTRG